MLLPLTLNHPLILSRSPHSFSLFLLKGDRVCIYMPMTPYVVYAMLACARIGAIHSVVFAGFSVDALRTRIINAGCRVVVTADQVCARVWLLSVYIYIYPFLSLSLSLSLSLFVFLCAFLKLIIFYPASPSSQCFSCSNRYFLWSRPWSLCASQSARKQGLRGGKTIPLKQTVDEALLQCPSVHCVLTHRRTG